MLFHFLLCLLAVLSFLLTAAGMIYYVKPTEPCAHNSSCLSNETCHTMDHYASNSSHYFSPDQIDITLYFMCGVHNCTRHLVISDLQTFAMIGRAGRQHVIINMQASIEAEMSSQDIDRPHLYTFRNVTNTLIRNISVCSTSVSLEDADLIVTYTTFYGHKNSTSQHVSVINITGSSAFFGNCNFRENNFLQFQLNAEITVYSCTFHSYNHVTYSAVGGLNSTLNVAGSVYFTDNTVGSSTSDLPSVCGAAIFLDSQSILNINSEASVHFVNNIADCGGAVYLKSTIMTINNKVNITFNENKARTWHKVSSHYQYYIFGGAVLLHSSVISTGSNANIEFNSNFAGDAGGGIFMSHRSEIRLSSNTVIIFKSNSALNNGGAITVYNSSINITNGAIVKLLSNSYKKSGGGAVQIYKGELYIQMSFLVIENNTAPSHAGGGFLI